MNLITARRVKKDDHQINGRTRILAYPTDIFPSWSRYGQGKDAVETFNITLRVRDRDGDITENFNVHVDREIAKSIIAYWNEKLTAECPHGNWEAECEGCRGDRE